MSKILNNEFVDSVTELLGFCEEMELRRSFLNSEEPDIHRWRHVLILKSYLGQETIKPEEARQLMNTDLKDNVFKGSEELGYEVVEEDDEFEESTFHEYKLWI